MKQLCPECNGSGKKWIFKSCKNCNGKGTIHAPISKTNGLPIHTGKFAICESCGLTNAYDYFCSFITSKFKNSEEFGGFLERKCTNCNFTWKECCYKDNIFEGIKRN